MRSRSLPLVYACSGCSSVAQAANHLAVKLDREGKAEMSCISGVGGGVRSLVKTARSGCPVLALDGCALACVKACLANAGVQPDIHLVLNQLGARKRYQADCSEAELAVADAVVTEAAEALQRKIGRAAGADVLVDS
ncbi:putative zinc-binding protein [Ralstonia solanacearum]|uniref:putative zinc-binding protein n=1 Tax=Ralstonia solanacearum TaxID=305 RepID=UPI0032180FD9